MKPPYENQKKNSQKFLPHLGLQHYYGTQYTYWHIQHDVHLHGYTFTFLNHIHLWYDILFNKKRE